jgi:hypothetical protein
MEPRLLSLPSLQKKSPDARPVLNYVILLRNGNTISQKAQDWSELSGADDEGIAYIFYINKCRVLHLEFSEVRSVLCEEYCDVKSTLTALKNRRRKKVVK